MIKSNIQKGPSKEVYLLFAITHNTIHTLASRHNHVERALAIAGGGRVGIQVLPSAATHFALEMTTTTMIRPPHFAVRC